MTQPIFEIRDYTIAQPDYAAYKTWAEDLAGPWLKANLNVLEFWMDAGIEAEVAGTDPKVSPHGKPTSAGSFSGRAWTNVRPMQLGQAHQNGRPFGRSILIQTLICI